MNKMSTLRFRRITNFLLVLSGLVTTGLLLLSFTLRMTTGDILKQLGMTKTAAEQKIANSILGGYLNTQGVKNLKQIVTGNKKALAVDLLAYTKKYTATADFISQYKEMREKSKPVFTDMKTPAEFQQETIASYREQVKKLEESLRKADASMKPVFQQTLDEARKQLKDAEDPNHKMYVNYRNNYEQSVQQSSAGNEQELKKWENEYPADHRLFLKKRLLQFMEETRDIDFTAQTIIKNGKKVFVKPEYEQKNKNWKMAYRSGKDVVETARNFVQQWLKELESL